MEDQGFNLSRSLQATEDSKQAAINPANSTEQKLEVERDRRTRIPLSVPRAKLSTPDLPGYHCHWVNDTPGRISQAIQGGYDYVSQGETIIASGNAAGDPLGHGTDLGSRVSVVVGSHEDGNHLRAYLMKIRLEWFKEDQDLGQERVNNLHDAMRSGNQASGGDSSNRYVKSAQFKSNYSRAG